MNKLRIFFSVSINLLWNFSYGQEVYNNCNSGKENKNKKNYEQAIIEYSKCIKDNPNASWLYNERGICFSELGKQSQALNDFILADSLRPNSELIINNIGIAHEMSDRYEEAINYYNKAIALKADYTDPYFNKARTYEKQKLFDSAENNYRKVVQINPKDKGAYIVLAMFYENISKFDSAIHMQSKAIEIDSNDADLYYYRAIDYDTMENYNLAIQDYDTFLMKTMNNFDYSALCRRGKSKELLGDREGALKDYSKAIQGETKFKRAYLLRIKLLIKLNDLEKACKDYKILNKLDKKSAKEFEKLNCN